MPRATRPPAIIRHTRRRRGRLDATPHRRSNAPLGRHASILCEFISMTPPLTTSHGRLLFVYQPLRDCRRDMIPFRLLCAPRSIRHFAIWRRSDGQLHTAAMGTRIFRCHANAMPAMSAIIFSRRARRWRSLLGIADRGAGLADGTIKAAAMTCFE